ncbi:rod shape-determining protein RodA [Temperatibacter marinus]|uniref:Peptidoglycan glycosyltransferase MrdB n=1 Tax=Temperatibacter marinus TaxID=1456591 RepID=A0AA52HAI1_9PROT|nr:rod shape-determining protein RodA [Temperatibacter marinus]WND02765.1 rod shape-determining protein RodA [Temperatibacter marinus]
MGKTGMFAPRHNDKTWWQRLIGLNWFIVLLVCGLASVGVAMLYSVSGGTYEPYAAAHIQRFALSFAVMIVIATTDIRVWMSLSYPAWFFGLILLVVVEFIGHTGMGGQRWLDLGFMRLQPSELMKVAVVMAMARYFHGIDFNKVKSLKSLIIPVFLVALPILLVLRQPDLGTSLMILAGGIVVIFLAGVPRWLFIVGAVLALVATPIAWSALKDYQKSRVITFMNPESDPYGAGYQIIQSKIAIGSGGMSGKGFLQGTQSHLKFLPEMRTDFIFTAQVEEFGLVGGAVLLALYMLVFSYGVLIGVGCRNHYGRLLASGLGFTLFLYTLINVGMVMGLMPVVGVPLPLVSYGGSAMLTYMIAVGLILCVATNRHMTIAPKGASLFGFKR